MHHYKKKSSSHKDREEESNKGTKKHQKTMNKMVIALFFLPVSIITFTLNVNILNSPIKRHRVAQWIKKKKKGTQLYALQDTHFSLKNTHS